MSQYLESIRYITSSRFENAKASNRIFFFFQVYRAWDTWPFNNRFMTYNLTLTVCSGLSIQILRVDTVIIASGRLSEIDKAMFTLAYWSGTQQQNKKVKYNLIHRSALKYSSLFRKSTRNVLKSLLKLLFLCKTIDPSMPRYPRWSLRWSRIFLYPKWMLYRQVFLWL